MFVVFGPSGTIKSETLEGLLIEAATLATGKSKGGTEAIRERAHVGMSVVEDGAWIKIEAFLPVKRVIGPAGEFQLIAIEFLEG